MPASVLHSVPKWGTAAGKSAGKYRAMFCVWMYMLKCTVAVEYCPAAPDRCLAHRECAFGSEDLYQHLVERVANLTGCTDCANICSTCNCDLNASVIHADITAGLFCDESHYCKDKGVTLIMNYRTANYDTCEAQIIRMQTQLISLCGYVNTQCCNGKCTQQFQITTTDALCDQSKRIPWLLRWSLTIYVTLNYLVWTLATTTV